MIVFVIFTELRIREEGLRGLRNIHRVSGGLKAVRNIFQGLSLRGVYFISWYFLGNVLKRGWILPEGVLLES